MIVQHPSPVLRKKSLKVKKLDKTVQAAIDLLSKALLSSNIGVGLSAPQIGSNLRIVALKKERCPDCQDCDCDNQPEIIFNPEVVDTFGKTNCYPLLERSDGSQEDFLEGCLSLPKTYGTVRRWLKVKVKYQMLDKDNQLVNKEETVENLRAIVFQHEIDHLDGILFIDRIKKEKGKLFKEVDGKLIKIASDE